MVIGIDLGSTTTKIVFMEGGKVVDKYRIDRKDDYEEFLRQKDLSGVTKIVAVGTGASYMDGDICGIHTEIVEEFHAVALGGHYLSGFEECMVVSLGTGTSFVYVNNERREHVGGTGIGGALLYSLSKYGLGIENVNEFMELARKGSLEKSDLLIKDISKTNVAELLGDVTVANMAKIDRDSSPADYAFGACNLIFQNVGVMAVLADKPYNTKSIVVMGSIGTSEVAKCCFDMVGNLFGYKFVVPEDSLYGVAIGAILWSDENYINNLSYAWGRELDDPSFLVE